MKYSTKGKTCLFHFRRFRFENVVAKARRVQKVLEWMESSSEVTQLRITRHGMAKLKSSCKRNTLSSLFLFLSFLLLLSLFVRSKVKFSFLLERWGWYFRKLSAEISRTIFERIYRFEQKETARNFQIFVDVLSNVVGSKMISRNQFWTRFFLSFENFKEMQFLNFP